MLCCRKIIFFIYFIQTYLLVRCNSADYNVQWIEGPITINHTPYNHNKLVIYCFKGIPKKAMNAWTSAYIRLEIESDYFEQYKGCSPDEVLENYNGDSSIWPTRLLPSYKARSLTLDPFNNTCIALKTDQKYTLKIQIYNVDNWKLALLVAGVLLFIFSRSLSENTLFFYICGISFGVCTSVMILVYFVSKMLPGKPFVYTTMLGGWAMGLYALKLLWSNFQPLIYSYKEYIAWYVLATSLISFIVCYKKGPPTDQKSKNLISWGLQALALVSVYFSTQLIEVYIVPVVIIALIRYGPYSWILKFLGFWRRKYPPKRTLLTKKEYYEQGVRETARALEELRQYCHSPDCKKWDLIDKLDDPRRFSKFINGSAHMTDAELSDYHSDIPFLIKRKNLEEKTQLKQNFTAPTFVNDDYLTSDDSSFSDG